MNVTSIPWKKFPALLGLIALTACAGPRLEVATAPSQPSVTLSDASIHMTLLPNTWSGYPSDLNRSYTPVEIKIQNDRTEEILLRYADFLAIDEASNQYQAVPPGEVAQALFGSRLPRGDPGWGYAGRGPARGWLLAWHGPWWPGPWPYGFWYPYSSHYDPDPFFYEYPYRWPRALAYDILTLGVREGRILPGARVEGCRFLQQATQKGNLLTLSWTPASADGKPLATLSSQFRIVR
jgi:hypothetical protein